jgi:hypothetical protein
MDGYISDLSSGDNKFSPALKKPCYVNISININVKAPAAKTALSDVVASNNKINK